MNSDLGKIILYQSEDGHTSMDVKLKDETVWLTLNQMAELLDRDKSVISRHLGNVFQTGELAREAVVAKNATTASDGKTYQVDYYNLDAIISVGYRVNSKRGTQFRIWATTILKDLIPLISADWPKKAWKRYGRFWICLQAPWKVITLSAMKDWQSWKSSTAMQGPGSFFCNMTKQSSGSGDKTRYQVQPGD